jgi:hypothetical protein
MGTDLFAFRKSQVINIHDEVYIQRDYISSYPIWSNWTDYEWPECLQYFWWHIYDYNSGLEYAKKIREYYPKDEELILFATWLEKFETNVIFELSI